MPSLLGIYTLKSVHGFDQAAIRRKKVAQEAYFDKFRHAMGAPPVIRTGPNLAVWSGPMILSHLPILTSVE